MLWDTMAIACQTELGTLTINDAVSRACPELWDTTPVASTP